MACDEEAAGGLGRDLHARGLGSSRWSRALWAPVRIACVGGGPRYPLDFFGEAMPGAGPYDEANVPLDPVRQPAAGRRRRGCAQGAIASAATISTIPFEATTRPTIVRRVSDRTVIRVCVAGITGWTGRPVADAIERSDDLELVGGVSRSAPDSYSSVAEALDAVEADVLVDYTHATAVKGNVMAAIERSVNVVVGSSGLAADDYAEIDAAALERGVGVVAAGNFSLTAAMLLRAATDAARHLGAWEVIDFSSAGKADAPSGTARELAERLSDVRAPAVAVPVEDVVGPPGARGATVAGTQVHSVRLPSFIVSTEVVFAADGERLTIRHDAGETPAPYVAGTLLAIRAVPGRVGLTRGLDRLLD